MQWAFFRSESDINVCSLCRRFTGIEFAVVHARPPVFFIIQKRERLSPDESALPLDFSMFSSLFELVARPLAVYFIMNSRIYQSPDLYTVVSNRLVGLTLDFRGLLDESFSSSRLSRLSSHHWISCENTGQIIRPEQGSFGLSATLPS